MGERERECVCKREKEGRRDRESEKGNVYIHFERKHVQLEEGDDLLVYKHTCTCQISTCMYMNKMYKKRERERKEGKRKGEDISLHLPSIRSSSLESSKTSTSFTTLG